MSRASQQQLQSVVAPSAEKAGTKIAGAVGQHDCIGMMISTVAVIDKVPVQHVIVGVLFDGFGIQRCCLQEAAFLVLFIALIFQA